MSSQPDYLTASPTKVAKAFKPSLKKLFKKYNDTKAWDNLAKTNDLINQGTTKVTANINKALDNHESAEVYPKLNLKLETQTR